jgi:hypothetical protein
LETILHAKKDDAEIVTAALTYNLNDGVNRAVTPSEASLALHAKERQCQERPLRNCT